MMVDRHFRHQPITDLVAGTTVVAIAASMDGAFIGAALEKIVRYRWKLVRLV